MQWLRLPHPAPCTYYHGQVVARRSGRYNSQSAPSRRPDMSRMFSSESSCLAWQWQYLFMLSPSNNTLDCPTIDHLFDGTSLFESRCQTKLRVTFSHRPSGPSSSFLERFARTSTLSDAAGLPCRSILSEAVATLVVGPVCTGAVYTHPALR